MNKVIALVGPTNSGKTELAVKLAQEFNGVIISADSRQIFRSIQAGTNKVGEPTVWHSHPARTVHGIYQVGLDLAEVGTRFTLADWLEAARELIKQVLVEGQLPIVCGGTGLYVTALLEGYQLAADDPAKRQTIENLSDKQLSKLAEAAGIEDTANRRRLIRQLEIVGSQPDKQKPDFISLVITPAVDRDLLYQRADAWVARVFPEVKQEVHQLLNQGVSVEVIRELGLVYRLAYQVITGQVGEVQAVEQSATQLRHYIRRQLTWWRHHGDVVSVSSFTQAQKIVSEFLSS